MGGGSKKQTVGYWYKLLYHAGLSKGPIDAFLEFRGGDRTAWQGELTASGTITIDKPKLWGGTEEQGGIVSDVDVMFGEAAQAPNAYLLANLGDQVPAWRGLATLVFKGGKYGAMNPYPQKASYKIRKIKQGWDGDCWYPEKAQIPLAGIVEVIYPELAMDAYVLRGPPTVPGTYIEIGGMSPTDELVIEVITGTYTAWSRWIDDSFNGGRAWTSGITVTPADGSFDHYLDNPSTHPDTYYFPTAAEAHAFGLSQPPGVFTGSTYYRLHFYDWVVNDNRGGLSLRISRRHVVGAMNPAHILYFARTNADMGREPTASINDASLTAAADTLYDEGFGICTTRDPTAESVEEFEQRISKLIDGAFSRDPITGQWHLDLARGDYVPDDLPILTDDDILEFKELPSTLDNAVNSVSVKYFDPEKKETITTPPVQARALIAQFGTIHQTIDYPEIPTADLAVRVALRELRATATPTRALELVCTRKPGAWRVNTYFRLQVPKRGIADMVCIVGEKQSGNLKSGAIRLKATQDIYSMPATAFVDIEPGIDTEPPQTPLAITAQAAFESPYTEVVTALPRAELAVLPADVGYLATVAADPARSTNYTVMVDAGAGYAQIATGDWAPTATVVEASGYDDLAFTLASGSRLDEVEIGSAALWGTEIVRVDTLDVVTGALTLGRGCADTVPVAHAAGERIWFYGGNEATDETEYTDGETIAVKLLTNTSSQQLAAVAAAIPVTFDARIMRPYPPGKLRINGGSYPDYIEGAYSLSWAHRDRIAQADQLIDTEVASIGPETGTTGTLRLYGETDTLLRTETGLTGTSYPWSDEGADSGLGIGGDPYWNNVVALLHFDGADASTTFTDETGRTWAPVGNAQIDIAQSVFGGASGLFDGSGDRITTPNDADIQLGSGDWTIEGRFRSTSIAALQGLFTKRSTVTARGLNLFVEGSKLALGVGDTNTSGWEVLITSAVLSSNTWYDVAAVRAGNTYYLFLAGALVGSTTWAGIIADDTSPIVLGSTIESYSLSGWLDEWRITKGVARYTEAYTPAPAPFLGAGSGRLNNRVRCELESERDGLVSGQKHDVTVIRVGYGYSYGYSYGGIL